MSYLWSQPQQCFTRNPYLREYDLPSRSCIGKIQVLDSCQTVQGICEDQWFVFNRQKGRF
ncbi:hypothetical protein Tcan_13082 [Toxocara canis]|uniref:Uncharacterized protein n=1 Tax=Toxocara canis TaxID=6265 RepID=A0A0B2UWR3_TOXCA|nr:hypothetical protein Tcan_13082 [Toxocara canis]